MVRSGGNTRITLSAAGTWGCAFIDLRTHVGTLLLFFCMMAEMCERGGHTGMLYRYYGLRLVRHELRTSAQRPCGDDV